MLITTELLFLLTATLTYCIVASLLEQDKGSIQKSQLIKEVFGESTWTHYKQYTFLVPLLVSAKLNLQGIVNIKGQFSFNKWFILSSQLLFAKVHGEPILATPQNCSDASNIKIMTCTITKNWPTEDIQEWIEYHRWIGIDHFYIREHQSHKLKDDVIDYINQGIVSYTWTDLDRKERPIYKLFQECLDNFRNEYDFIAFIDSDEYIVMQNGQCLNSLMEQFTDYGGLAMNWIQMGTSGHVVRPHGATLGNYVNCNLNKTSNFNRHVKSIVNTKYGKRVLNTHFFFTESGKPIVNEQFVQVHGHNTKEASWDFIAVHHYQIKSGEDYERRKKRGHPTENPVHAKHETLDNMTTSFCMKGLKVAFECCTKFYIQS